MALELFWIIGSTFLVSLLSLVGVFALSLNEKSLQKIIILLVGFSAGALIGGALIHLLPESLEEISIDSAVLVLILGFSSFFLIERILHWHHCHKNKKCNVHTLSYMNLIGDSVHNFIDGVIIAVSYLAGIPVGIATTVAVIAHEIPQEIGDFGVLVYGGMKKQKALLYNFLTALTAIVGALVGYFLSGAVSVAVPFILPFAAGGFVYIGASDLIPELHKEAKIGQALLSFVFFLFGILFMLGIKAVFGG